MRALSGTLLLLVPTALALDTTVVVVSAVFGTLLLLRSIFGGDPLG